MPFRQRKASVKDTVRYLINELSFILSNLLCNKVNARQMWILTESSKLNKSQFVFPVLIDFTRSYGLLSSFTGISWLLPLNSVCLGNYIIRSSMHILFTYKIISTAGNTVKTLQNWKTSNSGHWIRFGNCFPILTSKIHSTSIISKWQPHEHVVRFCYDFMLYLLISY